MVKVLTIIKLSWLRVALIVQFQILFFTLLPLEGHGGELVIAENGNTLFQIYRDPEAVQSVKDACVELQTYIRKATGVELSITGERDPALKSISVGKNVFLETIGGIDLTQIPLEGYRIKAVQGNVFIVGIDTPENERTSLLGFSRGSQYGVLRFLENWVGIRWLMPGLSGEYVPQREAITIPDTIDLAESPAFPYRVIGIDDPQVVKDWARHLRVSTEHQAQNRDCGIMLNQPYHSWSYLISPSEIETNGWNSAGGEEGTFCTRRYPDAIEHIYENLATWIETHPLDHIVPISPKDGLSFCRCETCSPYTTYDFRHGWLRFTKNIFDYYAEIANANPDIKVGGIAYHSYAYPVVNDSLGHELPPAPQNFYLEWTPTYYYGNGLYKDVFWNEFADVAASWAEWTSNIGYSDYGWWHRSYSGAPYSGDPGLLAQQLRILRDLGYRGVRLFGPSAWGYGGLQNYIMAKLMWNPDENVSELQNEWLELAYGEAAVPMSCIYSLIENNIRDYKRNIEPQKYTGANYEIDPSKIEHLYLPMLPIIETYYNQALANSQCGTFERKRVEMFGSNMKIFYYRLREAGYMPEPDINSPFYLCEEQWADLISIDSPFGWDKPGQLEHGPKNRPLFTVGM